VTTSAEEAERIGRRTFPIVLKADGLAAGEGVVVASTRDEAMAAIDAWMRAARWATGGTLVIEEFLEGEEASILSSRMASGGCFFRPRAITSGSRRRHGTEHRGMGACAPARMPARRRQGHRARAGGSLLAALRDMGTPYRGVLYPASCSPQGPQI
jgi:phosphoribosylamine--glycine ligase